MSIGDVFRTSSEFFAGGGDGNMVYTLHYRVTAETGAPSSFENCTDLAIALKDQTELSYLPILSDRITFEGVECVGITDPQAGAQAPSGLQGVQGEEVVSLRSAPVVSLKTGLRGRSFNGRIYLMPPRETQQASGELLATALQDFQNYFTDIREVTGPLFGSTFDVTVYSRKLSEEQSTVVDNLVSQWIVRPRLGSLRGRQNVSG